MTLYDTTQPNAVGEFETKKGVGGSNELLSSELFQILGACGKPSGVGRGLGVIHCTYTYTNVTYSS